VRASATGVALSGLEARGTVEEVLLLALLASWSAVVLMSSEVEVEAKVEVEVEVAVEVAVAVEVEVEVAVEVDAMASGEGELVEWGQGAGRATGESRVGEEVPVGDE